MPRSLNALAEQFDSAYRDQPHFVAMKARLLAAFDLLLLAFIPCNVAKLLWMQPPELLFRILSNASFGFAALVSLLLVRTGRLKLAGNALVLLAIVPIHILAFLPAGYPEPLSAGILMFIFDLVMILLALVFASGPVAWITLAIVVGSHVAFHFVALHTPPIAGSLAFAAGIMLRDGLIAIGFVFFLGIVLSTILTAANRRSEQSLRESRVTNENLGRLVAERTRELEIATQRANEASRAKGDFLANMSHEIRTPLNGIIASCELLLARSDLSPAAADNARVIADSGDLLLQLIGGVLDLSKIEAGQLELEERTFDLAGLVEDCGRLMQVKAAQGGVRLEPVLPSAASAHFFGDALRLRQILLNLISNAIKFTPSGGTVRLEISVEHQLVNPPTLRFEVRDTGIGMDETARQRLFHRFAQADSSMSRRYGGTGLGLAISARLVELMGGRLEVESRPGEGSAFHFAIPLRKADVIPRPEATAGEAPVRLGLSLLVAEDNPTNRKILAAQLDKLGCHHEMARDGEEALETLRRGPLPDAILMDCDMPRLDGWDAARCIRAWASDPSSSALQRQASGLPIIALTAATLPEERKRCFEVGMTDYLAKPLKLAGLEAVLRPIGVRKMEGDGPPVACASPVAPYF